jgi:hypothetical protein
MAVLIGHVGRGEKGGEASNLRKSSVYSRKHRVWRFCLGGLARNGAIGGARRGAVGQKKRPSNARPKSNREVEGARSFLNTHLLHLI